MIESGLRRAHRARVGELERRVSRWLHLLGPGLVTGAADDDPSGIATYSIAGASTGFSMLWIVLLTTPMMIAIQGACARIGIVTGMGLAAAMRTVFPRWLVVTLALTVIGANTLNLAADLAGMAASAHLVVPAANVDLWVVVFGAVVLFGEVYLSYRVFTRIVKWLCASLLAYVVTAFVVHPPWLGVLASAVVPHVTWSGRWMATAMGVIGTTITPYLFFWQPAMEVENQKAKGILTPDAREVACASEVPEVDVDNRAGMIYSNVTSFFIIVTTAATLGAHGHTDIATVQDAAQALRPLAGDYAALLFTLGVIATGLIAVPVLAGSSAYVAAEVLGFREGLGEQPNRARAFYAVIVLGIFAGMLINLLHVDAIAALFWCAVINGFTAVPLLVFITLLANNRGLMGAWRNSPAANAWSVLAIVLMSCAAVATFAIR